MGQRLLCAGSFASGFQAPFAAGSGISAKLLHAISSFWENPLEGDLPPPDALVGNMRPGLPRLVQRNSSKHGLLATPPKPLGPFDRRGHILMDLRHYSGDRGTGFASVGHLVHHTMRHWPLSSPPLAHGEDTILTRTRHGTQRLEMIVHLASVHIRCEAASMDFAGAMVGAMGCAGGSWPGIPPLARICA